MKKKIVISLIIAIIVISLFYWFELRPYFAVKECGELERATYTDNSKGRSNSSNGMLLLKEMSDFMFSLCIHSKGIR